jgi:photosystem II stability/assembly factor-like uncharacterized protein
MKRIYILIYTIIALIYGCEKKEESNNTKPVNPPKAISIIQGNNQVGYPNQFLPDSIILEIIPEKSEDIKQYSYSFKSSDHYTIVHAQDTIVDNKLYIKLAWQLNNSEEQKLIFYLEEKCAQDIYSSNCPKIDSISIYATVRKPWAKIFAGDMWTLYDIHFSDVKNGIAVGDLPFSKGYLKTQDGGETWSYAVNNRNDLYHLSFSDPDTGIVIVTNNYAQFTNNGGQTFFEREWTPPIIGHRSSADYFLFNAKKMITVGRQGAIAKTIDGGRTWTAYQGFTFKNNLSDITCTDNEICYACGSIGKIIKTLNSGETWEEQEILLNNDFKRIYFLDNNNGFAAGQLGAFVRTTNGGADWEIISTGLKFTIIEIHFYNRDSGYIISNAGEIGLTRDGGVTWELLIKANYGINELTRAYFKGNTIFGLQGGSIYKYELSNE